MNPLDFAIVIGINNYPFFQNLNGAENDANEMRDWLISPDGGGLPKDNCEIITSSITTVGTLTLPLPIRNSIDDKISKIVATAKHTSPRRLYFYFSGHGIGVTFDDGGLCLAGWNQNNSLEGISVRKYKLFFEGLQIFKEIIFFFDCCRLKFTQEVQDFQGPSIRQFSPKTGGHKLFVAYGSEFNEASFEAESNVGNQIEIRGNFTKAIIEALKDKKALVNNVITSADLKKYLITQVPEIAKTKNQVQRADFGPTDDDIILYQETLNTNSTIIIEINIKTYSVGKVSLIDKNNQVISEINPPFPSIWQVTIPDFGAYALKNNDISETQKIIAVFPNAPMSYEF